MFGRPLVRIGCCKERRKGRRGDGKLEFDRDIVDFFDLHRLSAVHPGAGRRLVKVGVEDNVIVPKHNVICGERRAVRPLVTLA